MEVIEVVLRKFLHTLVRGLMAIGQQEAPPLDGSEMSSLFQSVRWMAIVRPLTSANAKENGRFPEWQDPPVERKRHLAGPQIDELPVSAIVVHHRRELAATGGVQTKPWDSTGPWIAVMRWNIRRANLNPFESVRIQPEQPAVLGQHQPDGTTCSLQRSDIHDLPDAYR